MLCHAVNQIKTFHIHAVSKIMDCECMEQKIIKPDFGNKLWGIDDTLEVLIDNGKIVTTDPRNLALIDAVSCILKNRTNNE